MTAILAIDDDPRVRRFLRAALAGHGHVVREAATAAEGLALLAEAGLVLLDLWLPDRDGLDVLRALRPGSTVPVIVLSARGKEGDKVAALDAGADDYLTKPFSIAELLARIRVALRHAAAAGDPATTPDVLEVGAIRIDRPRQLVTVDGGPVHLTPIELKILVELARWCGRVLTHRQLTRAVWGAGARDQSLALRVHVAALRRKIERHPARPEWLLTEAGVGYRLRDRPR